MFETRCHQNMTAASAPCAQAMSSCANSANIAFVMDAGILASIIICALISSILIRALITVLGLVSVLVLVCVLVSVLVVASVKKKMPTRS